jgi:hypothetical protein
LSDLFDFLTRMEAMNTRYASDMSQIEQCVTNLSYNFDLYEQNKETCNKLSRIVTRTSCLISIDLCKKLVQSIRNINELDMSEDSKCKLLLNYASKFEIF